MKKVLARRLPCLFAILFLLAARNPVIAQLVADFTPSITSGCSPLAVSFKNTSTGTSGSAVYTWNFGNGNGITTTVKTNPVAATYFTGQNYTVTLTVKDGAQTSTKTVVITVYKSPAVNFSSDIATGCSPLPVNFSGVASPGDGTITGYFWDFGDGNTLNNGSPNVSNIYAFAGTYSVSLTATNSYGCTNTLKRIDLVTVYPALVAAFNVDSTAICNLSQAVQFHNISSGKGPLFYNWNFGDGSSSNLSDPSHQYASKGSYSITLVVSNNYGCASTIVKPALIQAADFTADFTTALPLCTGNAISFTNLSSPAPTGNPLWDFGDGGSGIGVNYVHSYAAPGSYTVKLYEKFGGCADTVTKNISVLSSPPLSPFIFNKGISCQSPMLVTFKDTSAAAVSWHWQFTNNPKDSSNVQSPSFLYTSNGTYTPTLTISNANGCKATVSDTINTAMPTATIHADTVLMPSALYCSDVQATFSAVSQDTIASYFWSLGDGTTSTLPNPTNLYSTPGTYAIALNFTTIHGCVGVATPTTITVYPKPHANFTARDSLSCMNNQIEIFTNLDDSAMQFRWIYGDGSSDVNNGVYHTHVYTDSGYYNMMLIASTPGCKNDTATLGRFVMTAPIPALTASNNCDSDRLSAALAVKPAGGSKYIWSYGDGSPNDTDYVYVPVRNHHYPAAGIYAASVAVQFGACLQNTGPVNVYILPQQHPLLSSTKDTICASSALPYKITGLDSNYQSIANGSSTYYKIVGWQYNDGTMAKNNGNPGFKTTYTGSLSGLVQGKDSIRAIIQSRYFNCYDTSNYIPIHITGPIAAFGAQDALCFHSPIIFTDSSRPTDAVPIVKWQWNYGDGNTDTRGMGDTVQHLYAFPGTYKVNLTVTDSNGCTSTAMLADTNVNIYGAKAAFTWLPPIITPGFPITFYNKTNANTGVTFYWHFASDGSTSASADSLKHTFINIGSDTVMLIAYPNKPGTCIDTLVQVLPIKNIGATFTYTTLYIDHANCPPMVANFIGNTLNTIGLHWDFGDGATADNNPDPNHTYLFPGKYIITLTGYGANGITTTYKDSLMVKGPSGTLYSSLDQACIPAVDTLHTTSTYAGSYTWDFGDGTVMTTQDTLAVHTYILPGLFTPALILTDSTGCQVTFRYNRQLLMDTLHADLGLPIVLCDTGSVKFYPQILSFVADSLGYPLTYHWDFGTGNAGDTSNILNPEFHFYRPGDFVASLVVQSPIGCVANAYDSLHIVPRLAMPVPPDTTICIGGSAILKASGAYTYNWSPALSLNKDVGDSVIATPKATTTYTVIGEDKYHCFLDTVQTTVNVNALPAISLPPEYAVLPGDAVTIEPTVSSDVVSWSWSPPDYLNCTDCASPTSAPLTPTVYTLTVKTAIGCTSSATVRVRLLCSERAVQMANAFSPNGDGNNDFFYPSGQGIKLVKKFQVYSRWGQLLFSKSNFPPNDRRYGWDGSLNYEPQPSGTYVYLVEIECFTGETFFVKGTVELIR
ncbi:MAG: PKD domain-containing protein [Bacteroidetes bacterium]|nr:PKD domain-containing protein [Bacteroidota bacterium]